VDRSSRAADRRVLGVDPGSNVTGWGLIQVIDQRLARVESGVVRVRGSRAERLARIHDEISGICERLRPDVLSLEQSFVGDNVQTAFRLGEARGAIMVAAAGAGVPVVEYAPAAIKVAVVGNGRAAKTQVQTMVVRLLGLAENLAADEADALGAAICHVHTNGFNAKVAAGRSFGGAVPAGRRSAARGS
jgi:crossover junction endodeoxyribonuclease RuvC